MERRMRKMLSMTLQPRYRSQNLGDCTQFRMPTACLYTSGSSNTSFKGSGTLRVLKVPTFYEGRMSLLMQFRVSRVFLL